MDDARDYVDKTAAWDALVKPKPAGWISLAIEPIDSDPDLEPGGYLTLERADGRSVWRQRFVVASKTGSHYVLKPVDVMHGYG